MRVISVATLRNFWENRLYRDAEQPLKAWLDEVRQADWKEPADIKSLYGSASILKNRRVVFNIKGNDYRLVVAVAYNTGAIFVKFVGTHKQYDNIDVNTVEPE
ncbi:addiction module toxin RelE [Erwinia sp. OLTSP20]|uniref:type II toxin-antitoxin system HigB family toxin n=1 Tax=unclassified Erwinia TaxID=2622719 RepID=UPI000C19E291|nr:MULTISPECIES: type II toxin-antitoxin system HigB family toxin [unclassified Erwinia]PIJ52137.1 addiction module toxin RelE [Erwinia sp. OAMSP11]PIJ73097.1 addiction module toxin RelE [Erwinia sp. OLSSP12]PIJ84665.1 addiction module toxin RelE [Erwinia sp. OLCASP19]PIJ87312.1 addiction module toxin RelE [Erwinia sp. OLMTSP26]PIJ87533.1 addiction module toxin RelE [Erwinia sp. OLMDSP33]